jgi:DNA-binding response OmpR family regulator
MAIKKILLVDDDESFLETFHRILVSNGYSVETANTGRKALSKLTAADYDILILDVVLPDLRGDELVRELRSMKMDIAIILVTGFSYLQRCINTIELGLVEILIKPIEPSEVLGALELAFEKKGSEHSPTQAPLHSSTTI